MRVLACYVRVQSHMILHDPSLCPPVEEAVLIALRQISSNVSGSNSPVTAEHSMYISALISCAALWPSCG
jgi:hypothetical protein